MFGLFRLSHLRLRDFLEEPLPVPKYLVPLEDFCFRGMGVLADDMLLPTLSPLLLLDSFFFRGIGFPMVLLLLVCVVPVLDEDLDFRGIGFPML